MLSSHTAAAASGPEPDSPRMAVATTPAQVQALISYLEQEPHPMIVLDTGYNILAANLAYRRQFATDDKPYIGQKCYRISHHYDVPCDQAGEHCPMKRAIETRGRDRVLHIHHTPRGPEHVDVELRPILDGQQEIVAYVERLAVVRSASARPSTEGLVGSSAAFNTAIAALERVSPSMLPVLLLGESGTGKELFARAVHEASERAGKPFVVVDCSGLTETLFESELFGYEKGAFTGAINRKQGLVETARGGTLFLDEIGDVPLAMQVKLLRLIESGTFRRVGGTDTLHADFRLVAATHKPLREMVADGRFRQDLYYRISAFPIHLPALRERLSDIPLLVNTMLQRQSGSPGRLSVDPAAMALLRSYAWPGNIRELRNALERARLFADQGVILAEHLPPEIVDPEQARGPTLTQASDGDAALRRMIAGFTGTRRELATALGISERSLYRQLKTLGLD
jgi:transcriptional regulator with PAS, ATPase and Fis domain